MVQLAVDSIYKGGGRCQEQVGSANAYKKFSCKLFQQFSLNIGKLERGAVICSQNRLPLQSINMDNHWVNPLKCQNKKGKKLLFYVDCWLIRHRHRRALLRIITFPLILAVNQDFSVKPFPQKINRALHYHLLVSYLNF